jgi:hypothetical protein
VLQEGSHEQARNVTMYGNLIIQNDRRRAQHDGLEIFAPSEWFVSATNESSPLL